MESSATQQQPASAVPAGKPRRYFQPLVDIVEGPEGLTLLADVPGAAPDGVSIQFENGILSLTAEVPERDFGPGTKPKHLEYGVGGYRRRFELGEQIDVSKIAAELSHGVLKLSLPKSEKAQPHKIAVKSL